MIATTLLIASAQASTFAEVPSIERLATESAAVVHGEVIGSRTARCSVGLCTTHTVLVQRTLKGKAAETLEVTLPGGTLDGLTQRAAGVPLWEEGSHVVLFVATDGSIPLTGLLTVTEGQPLDPLFRSKVPATVDDLGALVRDRGALRTFRSRH